MRQFNFESLNEETYDILKEIGNIGAGNATSALSQMINNRIDMAVPQVELVRLDELSNIVGGPEELVVGIMLNLGHDFAGNMMFVMQPNSATNLVNCLMNKEYESVNDFTTMELSALKEIGNIIAGAYLNSISELTNLSISVSIPYMAIDMAGAILSVPAIELSTESDYGLFIDSQFKVDAKEMKGYFILIPRPESYGKLLTSLGV